MRRGRGCHSCVMRRSFSAFALAQDDLDRAFSLIRALRPDVTVEEWRAFAHSFRSGFAQHGSRGLMGIRNEANYLCGIFVFWVEAGLDGKRNLQVEPIAALDMVAVKEVMKATAEAVDAAASRLHCDRVRFRVDHRQMSWSKWLREQGYLVEAQTLSAPVPPITPHH